MHTQLSIFDAAYAALMCCKPADKVILVQSLYHSWHKQLVSEKVQGVQPIVTVEVPGRPDKPILVEPKYLPKRKVTNSVGHAALLHAIAHIEFNAINLALDAIYRFREMPTAYYQDWLQVAFEEAKHFTLLADYLVALGYPYGAFEAHNSLWEMAAATDTDVLVRMALVPRVLEARGLDVTPLIAKKLSEIQDKRGLAILDIIEREEVGHVAIGTRWFRYACKQQNKCPLQTFKSLISTHAYKHIKPPFATQNRLKAGFTQEDMEFLETIGSREMRLS